MSYNRARYTSPALPIAATHHDDTKKDADMAQSSLTWRSKAAALFRNKGFQSLMVCLFYATSSITLSVVNKAVLSSYDFQCYFLLLTFQLLVAIVFCSTTRRLGNPFSIPTVRDKARLVAALPMSVFFVINVAVG